MMQGQVFLKGRGRGLALFLSNFFKIYDFCILKLLETFQNCVMPLKKYYFLLPPYFDEKKVFLSCLKMNLKISHKNN